MTNFKAIGMLCAKIALIILNLCCIFLALCTVIFAVVDTKVLKQYGEDQAAGTYIGDIAIILICWIELFVAIYGVFGTIRNNAKTLYLYICFLMITMAIEILIIIYVIVQRYSLEFRVMEWLREDFFNNTTGDEKTHLLLWDQLQASYECCGLNGPEDYSVRGQSVRISCCSAALKAKTQYTQTELYRACLESSTYFAGGCENEILAMLRFDAEWLQSVIKITFCFEAVAMVLAMWVANNVKNKVHAKKPTYYNVVLSTPGYVK